MSNIPKIIPEKGFYYHYKHDPNLSVNNYAYELIGTGLHTENDCRPIDKNMVVYRPLYEAFVYKEGKLFDIRPLSMWLDENVKKDGKIYPKRFTKITDPEIIKELQKIKETMYPE